jgi:hypothetical protein
MYLSLVLTEIPEPKKVFILDLVIKSEKQDICQPKDLLGLFFKQITGVFWKRLINHDILKNSKLEFVYFSDLINFGRRTMQC